MSRAGQTATGRERSRRIDGDADESECSFRAVFSFLPVANAVTQRGKKLSHPVDSIFSFFFFFFFLFFLIG